MELRSELLKRNSFLWRRLIQGGPEHAELQNFAIVKIEAERREEVAVKCADAEWENVQSEVSECCSTVFQDRWVSAPHSY